MSPPLPILYSFRRCPYAIRARLALKVAGLAVEVREVVLRDKPAAMLAISPKGTVPVLQLPDGRVLAQSLEIMRWALAQADPQRWLVLRDDAAAQALIEQNDGPFKQGLDRYKYADRHPERPAAAWRDEAVALHLAPLDLRLQASPCLMGDEPTMVDMAILPFVRQFAQVDAAWFEGAPLHRLREWLARWTGSPLFEAVMADKLAPWAPGKAAVLL